MNIEEFASRPDSPRWEVPRNIQATRASSQAEIRAMVLYRTTEELEQLCHDSIGIQPIQDLLETWTLVTGPNSGKLQPNLMAWLNDSNLLERAVQNQRRDVVQVLLSFGFVPNEGAVSAALDHVMDTKDTSILELLIKNGWDINRVYNQVRPSIMSCLVQDATLVKWCLSLGGDPNALSPSKKSVLHSAAYMGSIESLEALIAAGGVIKSPSPSDDVVAYAVDGHDKSYDRIAVIEYLLDHGADINAYYAQNQDQLNGINIIMGRQTALHLAIGRGDGDLVKMLIKRGADPSKRMWNYSTAYTSIQQHMGDPNWRDHIEWIDSIAYARFSEFEGIARFLEELQHLEPSSTRC